MSKASLIELIKDYLSDVNSFMSLLKQKIGDEHPIRSARKGLIPKEGVLGDIKYNFHGKGCRLEISNRVVDFDFGSKLNRNGFDLWRLGLYAESRKGDFPQYQDQATLSNDFDLLLSDGLIYKSKDKSDSNYYLNLH